MGEHVSMGATEYERDSALTMLLSPLVRSRRSRLFNARVARTGQLVHGHAGDHAGYLRVHSS